MNERRLIAILFITTLLIGFLFYFIPRAAPDGDLVVESYTAMLHDDGTFTERYVYNVKAPFKYRMLYRSWNDDLTLLDESEPHVRLLNINGPEGMIPYAKDHYGRVYLVGKEGVDTLTAHAAEADIMSSADRNEAGVYNPGHFDKGTYVVEYEYRLFPPIQYDGEFSHLNLKLADKHVPYKSVVIIIPPVEEIYAHPPEMDVRREGDRIIVSGSSDIGMLLEIEMLIRGKKFEGYYTLTENVRERAEEANKQYYPESTLRTLSAWYLFIVPSALLLIYLLWGREKRYTVPRYLSFVPDPAMKPYMVNLLFRKDAIDFDNDGFYATLLDLHRRGKIEMEENMFIKIKDASTDDDYERKVFNFLKMFAVNGAVTPVRIKDRMNRAMKDRYDREEMLSMIDDVTTINRSAAKPYAARGEWKLLPLMLISLVLAVLSFRHWDPVIVYMLPMIALIPSLNIFVLIYQNIKRIPKVILFIPIVTAAFIACINPGMSATVFSMGSFVQLGIAFFFPSTLFGKWKKDGYMKKLQWDAFRNFLSDHALIKECSSEDLETWGEWLVYGTALGVGEKVEEAMNELKTEPLRPYAHNFYVIFHPVLSFTPHAGGSRGKGFGAGSGFGGGGAGGR